MSKLIISTEHKELLVILKDFISPWRKLTIAIDGRDNAGKSCLARFLSWQLGAPCIETDFCIQSNADKNSGDIPSRDNQLFSRLIKHRHDLNRPVIVEGIFILNTLEESDIKPDFVIQVINNRYKGSDIWKNAFSDYESKYYPRTEKFFSIITPDTRGT